MTASSHLTVVVIVDAGLGEAVRSRFDSLTFNVDPANVENTLAHLEAVIRRCSTVDQAPGRLAIDVRSGEVSCDGRKVRLSALELGVLRYLVERSGEIVTRQELLDHVWGYDAMPVTRTVDVRIAQLRRKLERDPANPQFIVTVRSLGYKFVADPESQ